MSIDGRLLDEFTEVVNEIDDVHEYVIDHTQEEKQPEGFHIVNILRDGNLKKLWKMLGDNGFKRDVYICGGYVRWMCSTQKEPAEASDIDIYCKDTETYEKLQRLFRRKRLYIKHQNEVSLTYRRPNKPSHELFGLKSLQLITPLRKGAIVANGSLTEILSNFDFSIIRIGMDYYSWSNGYAWADNDFEKDENTKSLKLKNIHCPISSTFRCVKYMKRGYSLSTGQMVKLFVDWENRDKEYRERVKSFFEDFDNNRRVFRQSEIRDMYSMLMID